MRQSSLRPPKQDVPQSSYGSHCGPLGQTGYSLPWVQPVWVLLPCQMWRIAMELNWDPKLYSSGKVISICFWYLKSKTKNKQTDELFWINYLFSCESVLCCCFFTTLIFLLFFYQFRIFRPWFCVVGVFQGRGVEWQLEQHWMVGWRTTLEIKKSSEGRSKDAMVV